ncbi:hypothetical protein NHX12_024765 [Muraenolepis orangiensis]|uniref:Sesquipedalian n=1 Tax=Muraenolepis orangiensis TaxID=630683 RepID=A0A9Q0EI38_9TELE|nr:hypothetical protein NHX12_024765 [Muraenolepis orangiensis]
MKINEKIVIHYETCDSPVDKEGFLYKKGGRSSSYQRRWFVLKGNLLFYKERRSDREPLGVLLLERCSVQLCESDERYAFCVEWGEGGTGGRAYKLAAEDQPAQESWVKALLSATHTFLSLLLMDLEARYRELGGTSCPPVTLKPTPYAPPGATASSSSTANQLLPPIPPAPLRPAVKKSPKLWPKRNANVTPIYGPALPQREWLEFGSGTQEEFVELHREFGEEVKELIADWLRHGKGGEQKAEGNLIDLE